MKLKNLSQYSDKLMKGKRIRLTFVCLSFIGAELFFRLADITFFSILLYTDAVSPMGLFTGENPIQTIFSIICMIMRYITVPPLLTASAFCFTGVCSEIKNPRRFSFCRVLLSPKIWAKSIFARLISGLISAVCILPAFAFGLCGFFFISEDSPFLFVHASALSAVSLFLWLRIKISLCAVPFVMAHFPKQNVFRVIISAFRLMKHRKSTLFRIFLRFGLTLRITKLFTASALFICISVKEDEYLERTAVHRGFGFSDDTTEFSRRSERRFKKASD